MSAPKKPLRFFTLIFAALTLLNCTGQAQQPSQAPAHPTLPQGRFTFQGQIQLIDEREYDVVSLNNYFGPALIRELRKGGALCREQSEQSSIIICTKSRPVGAIPAADPARLSNLFNGLSIHFGAHQGLIYRGLTRGSPYWLVMNGVTRGEDPVESYFIATSPNGTFIQFDAERTRLPDVRIVNRDRMGFVVGLPDQDNAHVQRLYVIFLDRQE